MCLFLSLPVLHLSIQFTEAKKKSILSRYFISLKHTRKMDSFAIYFY